MLESDVRTHRILSPNRRPLLISALLVALTSVPTMIVVAAGSASLDTAPSVRTPLVAEPRPGPLVLAPTPSSGLHGATAPSLATDPTAPLPPATVAKPRTSVRASSGGSGGGVVVGTGVKTPAVVPAPPVVATTPPAPEVEKPPVQVPPPVSSPVPVPVPVPAPKPTGTPIQDKAWPGWNSARKGKPEAIKRRDGERPRTGSADQSDVSDCPAMGA